MCQSDFGAGTAYCRRQTVVRLLSNTLSGESFTREFLMRLLETRILDACNCPINIDIPIFGKFLVMLAMTLSRVLSSMSVNLLV